MSEILKKIEWFVERPNCRRKHFSWCLCNANEVPLISLTLNLERHTDLNSMQLINNIEFIRMHGAALGTCKTK